MVQVSPLIIIEISHLLMRASKLWSYVIQNQCQRYDEQYAKELVKRKMLIFAFSQFFGIKIKFFFVRFFVLFQTIYTDKLQKQQNIGGSKKISSPTNEAENAPAPKKPRKCTPTSVNEVDAVKSKPKRPVSRFILFRSDLLKTRKVSMAETAEQWKNLSEHQRLHYQQRHQLERDQYKYESLTRLFERHIFLDFSQSLEFIPYFFQLSLICFVFFSIYSIYSIFLLILYYTGASKILSRRKFYLDHLISRIGACSLPIHQTMNQIK